MTRKDHCQHTATKWHPGPRGKVTTLEFMVWCVLYSYAQLTGSNPSPRGLGLRANKRYLGGMGVVTLEFRTLFTLQT